MRPNLHEAFAATQTVLALDGRGGARSADPETSKQAAARVDPVKRTILQERILRLFEIYGPMADATLYARLVEMERQLGFTKATSPSGCRSRRSELSKPNMDRLAEITEEIERAYRTPALYVDEKARRWLRAEGLRSPLIDSGRRETIDNRSCIIWEVA